MKWKDRYPEDIGPGDLALMRSLIAEGSPDPARALQALATFCRLVNNRPELRWPRGARPLVEWLAGGISTYLDNPKERGGLEKALGLRWRGHAINPAVQERNCRIVFRVIRMNRDGMTLTSSRRSVGAFVVVAGEFGVSEKEVRDVYYAISKAERDMHLRVLRFAEQYLAEEVSP